MDPVAFSVFGKDIFWYGIFVAAGFLGAIAVWTHLDTLDGRRKGFGSDFGFLVMVTGILGARMAYILANAPHYMEHPLEVIRIDQGGLVFYGGFIAASLAVIIMARVKRMPLLAIGDYGVTGLTVGHLLGRVGCFVNGCCFGVPGDGPLCVTVDGVSRWPVPLFEAIFNLILFGILYRLYRRRTVHGIVFSVYLMAYAAWRFVIEFIRGDARMEWLGLTVAQDISIALMLTGLVLFVLLNRHRPPSG